MIDRTAIEQILAQYTKHGWELRRVLLSSSFQVDAQDHSAVFGTAEIEAAELDGLWFSRVSRPGTTAWELRHLSPTPFALVENVFDGTADRDIELILKRMETKMIETLKARRSGH